MAQVWCVVLRSFDGAFVIFCTFVADHAQARGSQYTVYMHAWRWGAKTPVLLSANAVACFSNYVGRLLAFRYPQLACCFPYRASVPSRRYPEALVPPTFLPHPGCRFFPPPETGERKDGDEPKSGEGVRVNERGVFRVWEDSINDVRQTNRVPSSADVVSSTRF